MYRILLIAMILAIQAEASWLGRCLRGLLWSRGTAVVELSEPVRVLSPTVAYTPYDEEFEGGLTHVRVTTKVGSSQRVTHRTPINNNPLAWAALAHQSEVLRRVNPNNELNFLPDDFGRVEFDDGTAAYEMEYISGEDAHKKLYRICYKASESESAKEYYSKLLDWTEIFLACNKVLKRAHGLGIVHRDVKLSNFMITDGGVVKLIDFSSSLLIDAYGNPVLIPPTGDTTLEYLPPRLRNQKFIDPVNSSQELDYYALAKNMEEYLKHFDPGPAPQGFWPFSKEKSRWKKRNALYQRIRTELIDKALTEDLTQQKLDFEPFLEELETTLRDLYDAEDD